MQQGVELMTGGVLFLLGLSFVKSTASWVGWFDDVRTDETYRSIPIGCFTLLISSFIVAFHPVWNGFFMLVTLFGVLGIIEGAMYLLFPNVLKSILGYLAAGIETAINLWGCLFSLLGLTILFKLWENSQIF